ncbi:hexose transporter [Chiua virens]|nr:hexose transporter [Chiua virens]
MDAGRDGNLNGSGGRVQLESNDSDTTVVSQLAQQDNVPWYRKPNLRLLYLLMIPTCLAVEVTSGFDATMVNGLQAVPSWLEYFHHPRSASLGIMSAMFSLGSICSVLFVSPVVDKMGRRYSISLGGIISITGAILQGSALNYTMFVLARFRPWLWPCLPRCCGFFSDWRERAIMSSLFSTTYELGTVFAAGITLTTFTMTSNWGWRIPSFLQVIPTLLQVSFILFLPESPRWLVSKGRKDEAYAILVKYHAEGDENSNFVKAEYTQIEQTLEAELRISQVGRKELSSTPGMRKRVIVATFFGLFTESGASGLISYYLSPILDSIGIHDNRSKHIINLSRVSWSLTNSTVAAFIAPRYPRRRMFLTCTISLFVVFAAWTIASAVYSSTESKVSAHLVVALIFLYSPAYNIGFTVLPYTYLVELFPFHVRTRGITIYQWWLRCGTFFNQFVNPIGMDALGWRWYIIYCVWHAFQVTFVYVMFPETSGRTLEELTFLYEGEQEVYRHAEIETLHEQGQRETYGTMEGVPRGTMKRLDDSDTG